MALPEDWSRASALFKDELSETELVVEGLKQLHAARNQSTEDDAAMNQAVKKTPSCFQFQSPPRNSISSSELTRGDCLAGSPLTVAKKNRTQKNGSAFSTTSMDIRSLLQHYR